MATQKTMYKEYGWVVKGKKPYKKKCNLYLIDITDEDPIYTSIEKAHVFESRREAKNYVIRELGEKIVKVEIVKSIREVK